MFTRVNTLNLNKTRASGSVASQPKTRSLQKLWNFTPGHSPHSLEQPRLRGTAAFVETKGSGHISDHFKAHMINDGRTSERDCYSPATKDYEANSVTPHLTHHIAYLPSQTFRTVERLLIIARAGWKSSHLVVLKPFHEPTDRSLFNVGRRVRVC